MPLLSFSNGGDQRVVEGKYLINLSRAPFTPRIGVETSFLTSFVDLEKNKLVNEDLVVKVRIARLGGGGGKREFVFDKNDVNVQSGVMDFKYTFAENGLHEIFFDFALVSNPEKIYEAPDFLLDIQKPESSETSNQGIALGTITGVILGFVAGWFICRYRK